MDIFHPCKPANSIATIARGTNIHYGTHEVIDRYLYADLRTLLLAGNTDRLIGHMPPRRRRAYAESLRRRTVVQVIIYAALAV